MDRFTLEEKNLMCIYTTDTRTMLLKDLHTALLDIYHAELKEITISTIVKLEHMTDDAYQEIRTTIIPDETWEEEQEE